MRLILSFAFIVTATLSLAVAVRADQEYVWTGGSAGYSGTIILDSNSNPTGSISDIVSGQITTPSGTYDFDPTTIYFSQPAFDWNPSKINDMWIDWLSLSGSVEAGFGENYGGSGGNFVGSEDNPSDANYLVDFAGSWTAASATPSVPDAPATSALLGGALVGLAALRRRFAK